MANSFGKFCKRLRIDREELLFDMAKTLGVSTAFLSKVENGKKKPPQEWRDVLIKAYNLDEKQTQELDDVIFEARNKDSLDISKMSDEDKALMLSFARRLDTIDKNKLRALIE